MTWRDSVGRWHVGQLVIAWLVIGILSAGSLLGGWQVLGIINDHERIYQLADDSTFVRSQWLREDIPHQHLRDNPYATPFEDSVFLADIQAERTRRTLSWPGDERFQRQRNAVTSLTWEWLPFGFFLAGLAMTWVWFGARASTVRGEHGVS